MLLQVNTVEEKGGKRFVGVNGGFNIKNLAAYYQTPFIVAPLEWKPDKPKEKITLAGNINEAIDILAEDVALPAGQKVITLRFSTRAATALQAVPTTA